MGKLQPPKKYPKSTRRKDAFRVVSRVYAGVNLKKPPSAWDDSISITWQPLDPYVVLKQVGKGKYGEVYEAIDQRTNSKCVIKIMRPVKEHRLRREVKILRQLAGGPNIISLFEVARDPDTKTPCFVFDLVNAMSFRELQATVTDFDVRLYTYQLLQALDFCHSQGIMHRDVKPGNVLINHEKRQLRLIDWGLADYYHPGKELPVRVATRFYKGPELLVDIRDYDYSLDVWGVGCMLAAMVFKKAVFFRGEDEFDQLVKIARVLGTDELYRYCEKYGVELDPRLAQLCSIKPQVPWKRFVNTDNQHLTSPQAFDLLSMLLKYDHSERSTAAEALAHEYFAPVRSALASLDLPSGSSCSSSATGTAVAAAAVAAAGSSAGPSTLGTSAAGPGPFTLGLGVATGSEPMQGVLIDSRRTTTQATASVSGRGGKRHAPCMDDGS